MEPIKSLAEMKRIARELPSKRVAVVRADEVETITAIGTAVRTIWWTHCSSGPKRA